VSDIQHACGPGPWGPPPIDQPEFDDGGWFYDVFGSFSVDLFWWLRK
jgi:hypothetical protein